MGARTPTRPSPPAARSSLAPGAPSLAAARTATASTPPADRRLRSGVDPAAVAAAYDRYAAIYDRLFGWVLQDGREQLARCIDAQPGQRVLEFGVGSGLMLPLYPPHASVLGLDLSPGMLAKARERVCRLGLRNVELQLADAEAQQLPAQAFDHVVLPYVYSVTPDPAALMAEAFRLCKPGGQVWILNHFSGLGFWDWLERPLRPFARWIGFRAEFSYQTYVSDQPWQVVAVHKANLLGLSRIVQVRQPAASGRAVGGR